MRRGLAWLLNPGFDASFSDVFCALLGGGTLFIPGFPITQTKRLAKFIAEHQVTHADTPPSLLRVLAPKAFPSLKVVISGGEALDATTAARWADRVALFNAYGPTEATICTHARRITSDWTRPWLGDPLPGVQSKVRAGDALLSPEMLEDASGELWIGGENLAFGYFEAPELTDARFVVQEGERYFRTGDIVGWSAQGLYFMGRSDRQTKVHGCLVCPEEIEHHLRGVCPDSAVKIVGGDIHAYLGGDTSPDFVMKHLVSTLPCYMLPKKINSMPRLPRTASGKVDLQAL